VFFESAPSDVITRLKPLLTKGVLRVRDDGRLEPTFSMAWNTPWLHAGLALNRNCFLYQEVYHKTLGVIHPRCFECWKVVVRPKTLDQLMALREMQLRHRVPSKCGIERREYVHGLYGGYFYNDSLGDALACFEWLKGELPTDLTSNGRMIVKRACTEFELAYGPSDKWDSGPGNEAVKQVSHWLVDDVPNTLQPPSVEVHVLRTWVKWAYAHGDETYLNYTGGKPIYTPPVTYHPTEDSS